jgi:RHS repeat-associated protein
MGLIDQFIRGFGLYDYNARYYSSNLGRFVSPDTMVPDPQNPQNFNRYAYVLNNPLKYSDPSGHCPPSICHDEHGRPLDQYHRYGDREDSPIGLFDPNSWVAPQVGESNYSHLTLQTMKGITWWEENVNKEIILPAAANATVATLEGIVWWENHVNRSILLV